MRLVDLLGPLPILGREDVWAHVAAGLELRPHEGAQNLAHVLRDDEPRVPVLHAHERHLLLGRQQVFVGLGAVLLALLVLGRKGREILVPLELVKEQFALLDMRDLELLDGSGVALLGSCDGVGAQVLQLLRGGSNSVPPRDLNWLSNFSFT